MSNISRIQGSGPLLRRLRCGRVGRPVCERAGYKTQSSFPSTDFLNFFQRSSENQKEPVKSDDSDLFGPKWGPAFRPLWSAGVAVYMPRLRGAQAVFEFDCENLAFFHRTRSRNERMRRNALELKAFRSGQMAKSRSKAPHCDNPGRIFTAGCTNGRPRSPREPPQSATSPGRR